MADITQIRNMYLMLGTSCNMTCRHCSQIPVKGKKVQNQECSVAVLNFIKQWDNERTRPKTLWFWGGEPLLYLKTIKGIVEQLRGTDIRFGIFTNGLLLTEEVVGYLNEHGFLVIMSYDAPNPVAVRSKAPSEENIKCFLSIKDRIINMVFSAINDDIEAGLKVIQSKFPNTPMSIGIMQVMSDIPEDTYDYKDNAIRDNIFKMAKAVKDGNDPYGSCWKLLGRLIKRWRGFNKTRWLEEPYPPCLSGLIIFSVDLNGNVFSCHNAGVVAGKITEPYENLVKKQLQMWKRLQPTRCRTCEHLDICRSRCPVAMKTNDGGEYVQCKFMRELWRAVKDAATEYDL